MDGIILLDKPKGITSREACDRVKKILSVSKAGNSGTLDPNATGLLVICLGNSAKIMPALQGLDKEYLATVHFHKGIAERGLESLVKKFTGKLEQIPPVKSAVARKPREREVYSIEINKIEGKDAVLKIRCQAGTYIRKLADEMGHESGGAHLKDLRRTAVGDFRIEEAYGLKKMDEASESDLKKIILPIEKGVGHLNKLHLKDSSLSRALLGKPLSSDDFSDSAKEIKDNSLIALMSAKKELVALGRVRKRKVFIERLIKIKL